MLLRLTMPTCWRFMVSTRSRPVPREGRGYPDRDSLPLRYFATFCRFTRRRSSHRAGSDGRFSVVSLFVIRSFCAEAHRLRKRSGISSCRFLCGACRSRGSGHGGPARFCDGTFARAGFPEGGAGPGAKSSGRRSRAAAALENTGSGASGRLLRVPAAYILSGTLIPSRPAPEAMTSATVCDSLRRTACTAGSLSRRIGMSW